jgi:hypothetical protein
MTGMKSSHRLVLSVCVLALALGGCGGGGSVAPNPITPPVAPTPPPPPPPAPTPPPPAPAPTPVPPPGTDFDDAEYRKSSGASFTGAIAAYNKGATGQGVKIALIDTGVNPNLADFAGKIDPASQDVAGSRGITDTEGHGTATAATAAAARNGTGVLGVAFDSTIISFNTSNPDDCTEKDGCKHSSANIAKAIDLARVAGARVINISLGGADASFAVNAAVARAAQAGIIVVMSAGNDGEETTGGSPEGFALSAATAGNVIIAGAIDANRSIASYSNRAGSGREFYLAALGSRVVAPDETGALFYWSGTSFSAPVISGSVALLASAFPNLTGKQIMDLLFMTADDAGETGTDAIFGHGILNIGRAFQPQGTLSLPGSKTALLPVGGQGSTPMGDATPKLAGMVVLDGFSRAYVVDMADTLQRAPLDQPLASGLQGGLHTATAGNQRMAVSITVNRKLGGQPQVGFAQLGLTYEDARQAKLLSGLAISRIGKATSVALGISESGRTLQQRLAASQDNAFLVARDPLTRMGFYGDSASAIGVRHMVGPVGVTVTGERGKVYQPGFNREIFQPGYDIGSVSLDKRVGPATLTLSGSRLGEEQTMLGARFTGLVASGGATSWFADASAAFDFGRGWGAFASYRRGWSSAPGAGALAQSSRLSTDAWAFDVSKRGAFVSGDKLAIRLMQPLRVRSGGFDLNVPVSYDYATLSAGYEKRFFNLAPSGREIDLEAAYGMHLLGGELSANAFARRQPGHIAAMDADVGGAMRFTLGF